MTRERAIHRFGWLLLIFAACSVAGWRLYREYTPKGAKYWAWKDARVVGPTFTSPDGTHTVKVSFNDAGAMHSGNHWMWIVEYSRLSGMRVVAGGFVGPAITIDGEPVEFEWTSQNTFRVKCLSGRYRNESVWVAGKLD
jgi:hypothetical protein